METVLKTRVVPNYGEICGCGHISVVHSNRKHSDYENTGNCGVCKCDGFHKASVELLPKVGCPEVYQKILNLMFKELTYADTKYQDDKMSPYEMEASFNTLECELMELKREISRKKQRPDLLRKESIQVLAMAYKFCRDVAFIEGGLRP